MSVPAESAVPGLTVEQARLLATTAITTLRRRGWAKV